MHGYDSPFGRIQLLCPIGHPVPRLDAFVCARCYGDTYTSGKWEKTEELCHICNTGQHHDGYPQTEAPEV